MSKIVILVGKNEGFGTWQHHPDVFHCATLEDAQQFVALFNWRNIKGPWLEGGRSRLYGEALATQSR